MSTQEAAPTRTKTDIAEFGVATTTKCFTKEKLPSVPVKVDVDPDNPATTTKQLVAAQTADLLTQDSYIGQTAPLLSNCAK